MCSLNENVAFQMRMLPATRCNPLPVLYVYIYTFSSPSPLFSRSTVDFTRFRPTSTSPKFGLHQHNSSFILKRIQRNRINKVLKSKLCAAGGGLKKRNIWYGGWGRGEGARCMTGGWCTRVLAVTQVQTDFGKENGIISSHCLSSQCIVFGVLQVCQ